MNDKMIVKNFYERIVSENRLEELSKYVSENCALTLGDIRNYHLQVSI